jgi:excisionase family DNA binding protein
MMTTNALLDELMDVDESAAFLHIKQPTVRAWVLQKRVPYVKLGRRVFLRRSDLVALVQRSLVPARDTK